MLYSVSQNSDVIGDTGTKFFSSLDDAEWYAEDLRKLIVTMVSTWSIESLDNIYDNEREIWMKAAEIAGVNAIIYGRNAASYIADQFVSMNTM